MFFTIHSIDIFFLALSITPTVSYMKSQFHLAILHFCLQRGFKSCGYKDWKFQCESLSSISLVHVIIFVYNSLLFTDLYCKSRKLLKVKSLYNELSV